MDTNRNAPDEVDAYLAGLPDEQRAALQSLREIVHEMAPACKERVSYGIPMFRLKRDLVGLSAHTRHVALHTLSPALAATIQEAFPDIRVSGATTHFTPANPLPPEVIEAVLRARMAEAG